MQEYRENIEEEIVDELLENISNGVYLENDKLPSDYQLADYYGIPRIKVRKAYEKLEEMGYIYSRQGKGRYVRERSKTLELVLNGDESFSEKMIKYGYNYESVNLYSIKIEYNEEIYKKLNASINEEVYKIARLRMVDKEPIAIHISYVRKEIFKNIDKEGKNIISLFTFYRDNGFSSFTSGKTVISVVYPRKTEREILKCKFLNPLLKIEVNCIKEDSDTILDYSEILYRMDKFKMII